MYGTASVIGEMLRIAFSRFYLHLMFNGKFTELQLTRVIFDD